MVFVVLSEIDSVIVQYSLVERPEWGDTSALARLDRGQLGDIDHERIG
jgi:hypothetical protein